MLFICDYLCIVAIINMFDLLLFLQIVYIA